MGLAIMILGLAVFIAPHVFVTRREARAGLIARIGEGGYKGLFSLVSIVGVILIAWGFARYRATGWIDVWSPPGWMHHVTVALMWPSIIFIAAAYMPGNIKRALKHPMLVGVKLWAFAHLLNNGDLGSIVLFGAILAWAVFDRISLKRRTAPDIRARKGATPIVALTSYHAHTARIVDRHCDVILVGDSLGMVMHGLETTVPVTLGMMILQGLAVMRGSRRALVVVDLPFGSYEASREQAFASCARVLKETGCGAIKVEGGRRMAETIAFLVERGVPIMGHVGLTPQAINTIGSFRAQGREEKDWGPIEDDAKSVADAGAFSLVIEAVAEPLARRITGQVAIPTIGIGASPACDGQILVLEDMLGLSPRVPKFVKRYGDIGPGIEAAVAGFAREVRARAFPGPDHVYPMKKK